MMFKILQRDEENECQLNWVDKFQKSNKYIYPILLLIHLIYSLLIQVINESMIKSPFW